MNTKDPSCVVVVDGNVAPNQSLRKQVQQQHHKKQVKRRLHTCRPYQERLLNMAEARREIATALKYHREAMRQANVRSIGISHSLEEACIQLWMERAWLRSNHWESNIKWNGMTP
ncbi:hypothetical protein JHK87_039404 [Glycine soja]|nr:hypothetical protein JHK87_039404 [Glycine soja]